MANEFVHLLLPAALVVGVVDTGNMETKRYQDRENIFTSNMVRRRLMKIQITSRGIEFVGIKQQRASSVYLLGIFRSLPVVYLITQRLEDSPLA